MHLKGANSMAASEFSCRKSLVSTVGAISFLLCTNGLRKWSSGSVRPPFLTVKLLCHKAPLEGCTGTCVKLETKTHLKWKYGTFRRSISLKGLP